jgi:hypothetical protein
MTVIRANNPNLMKKGIDQVLGGKKKPKKKKNSKATKK